MAGLSVFWADDGLDTGPILLQKQCEVDIDDTVDTLYSRFLYPEGIRAVVGEQTHSSAVLVWAEHSSIGIVCRKCENIRSVWYTPS